MVVKVFGCSRYRLSPVVKRVSGLGDGLGAPPGSTPNQSDLQNDCNNRLD